MPIDVPVLLYNAALLLTDGLALVVVRGRPGLYGLVRAIALVIGAAAVLALAARDLGLFGQLGLLAWGLFLHLFLVAAGAALLVRRSSLRAAAGAAGLTVGVALLAVYTFRIEPRWLEVTRYALASPKLTERIRIVVIADLQTDHVGAYEERVLATAMAERPDLILLPGDYIQVEDREVHRREEEKLAAAIRRARISAPFGVLAVEGNVDAPGWPDIFAGLPAAVAVPVTRATTAGPLQVTALGLADSFDPRLRVPASSSFHVVFGHAPDFALGEVEADLLVAGHTHGGQVRIPGLGPILTLSRVPRSWAAGRTDLGRGRTLIVSRGIGMERGRAPRLRLFCRPELVVIDLVPARTSRAE